jgi:citrate lyase subunit beta/citryl-CoA lyase
MTEPFPRTFLFVPANRPAFVDSAFRSAAEAIVFDLEDSVVEDEKAAAREAVRSIVMTPRAGAPPLFVRINEADTSHGTDDLRALAGAPVAGFVIPKVQSTAVVSRVAAQAEGRKLVLLLETPRGVLGALHLAEAAGSSLAALAFGAEDFRAAMRVDADTADALLAYALPTVAVAAAAADVPAIDAPEMDLADPGRLHARCAAARALGFRAKFAIHPKQLSTIHEAFGPTPAQRLWAERVTQAYEQGRSEGRGSVRVDDRVVDQATVKRARQILQRSGT